MGVPLTPSEDLPHSPSSWRWLRSRRRRTSCLAPIAPEPESDEESSDHQIANNLDEQALQQRSQSRHKQRDKSKRRSSCPDSEATGMLRALLSVCFGKRTPSDILSVLADPGVFFRLSSSHLGRYEDQLDAFKRHETSPNSSMVDDSAARWANDAGVASDGFLPRTALASLFARAAYGCVLHHGDADKDFTSNAVAAYRGRFSAESNQGAFLEMSGVQEADILLSSWDEKTFEPAFVVFWVHEVKWLVVAVRGSTGWQALLTDVAADVCELSGGLAHSGMVRSAKWLLARVLPTVTSALSSAPNYGLVCTGHSLGANVAALMPLLLRDDRLDVGNDCLTSQRVALRQSVAYCFGTSPFMCSDLAARCKPFVLCVARDFDIVTRLSAFSVDRLLLELTEQSTPAKVGKWLIRKMRSSDSFTGSKAAVRDRTFGEDATTFELLVPPGTLLHLATTSSAPGGTSGQESTLPCENVVSRLYWPLPGFYQQILANQNMVNDHSAINYVEDMLKIVRVGAPPLAAQGLHLASRAAHDPEAGTHVCEILQALVAAHSIRKC